MKILLRAAALIISLSATYGVLAQDSLSLEECKSLALDEGVKIKNSHLDYLSAKMQRREARFAYFPTLDARAAGFKALNPLVQIGITDILGTSDNAYNIKYYLETQAGILGVNSTYTTLGSAYGAGLNLTQPVYAGGRIVNTNRLAELGIKAAAIREDISRRDIGAQVEEKYWTVVSLSAKQKVLEQALEMADVLLKDASSAVAAGLTNQSDCDKVNVEKQKLHSTLIRINASAMLAKMDLCSLIGLPGSSARSITLLDAELTCPDPSKYFREPAEIIATMDEARLLDLSVEQKKIEKSLKVGEALPEVGVGAYYGYGMGIGQPRANGAVYASIRVPISDWGQTGSRIRYSEYQIQKAQNEREHYCRMLELQLQQLWVEVESCWEEAGVKSSNLEWCLQTLEHTRSDHRAGLITSADLMQKEVECSNAECELIDARIAYRNALAAYCGKCSK